MALPSQHRISAAPLKAKFDRILPHLDERRRRLYLASEAAALGHGGITAVAAISGVSTATIVRGIAELEAHTAPMCRNRAPGGRTQAVDDDGYRTAAGAGSSDRAAYPWRPGLPAALDDAVAAHARLVSAYT